MKKILLTILLLTTMVNFALAATDEEIQKDIAAYNDNVTVKIIDYLGNIAQEAVVIDNVIEGKDKKDINASIKIVENQVKAIIKVMNEYSPKIKTDEIKKYHKFTMDNLMLRYDFLKEAVAEYTRKGKLTDKDQKNITLKFHDRFMEMEKKGAEISNLLKKYLIQQ